MADDERIVVVKILRGFLDDILGDFDWDWVLWSLKQKAARLAVLILAWLSGLKSVVLAEWY